MTINVKPFIKWAGGKSSIKDELIAKLPKKYSSYHELFLGGGAIFFNLQPKKAYISDINIKLITTYQSIQNEVETIITQLKTHQKKHNINYYLDCRKEFNSETDPLRIASLFIYLNKTCYNGLYRVNQKGHFNVPMGNYKNPNILDEDNLRQCSKILQNTHIKYIDFKSIKPKSNQFFYMDPPYHQTFTSYTKNGFDDNEQINLYNTCTIIDKNKGYFMQSNSDTPFIRKLYKDYNIDTIKVPRFISCNKNNRKKAPELIIRNYE